MIRYTIVGLLVLIGVASYAQSENDLQELYMHEQEALYQKALNLDLVEDSTYDVKFYYPDVEIALDEPFISGKVAYLVTSEIDGLTQLKLDLDDAFTVDSVTLAASGFEFEAQVLTVDFSSVYNTSDTLSFAVYYHGAPVLAGGFKGLRYENHDGNQLIIASLSTPFLAHTWWPCKDGTLDKADSVYVDITIKDTLVAGIPVIGVSNGVLSGVETFGNKKKFKWRHRYPIVPYYVMVAISNYELIHQTYNGNDSEFPLDYYVFNSHVSDAEAGVANLPEVFDLYTELFGPYPFRNEKYGMTQLGFYGGIENQTNTIINNMSTGWFGTSVHELAHSWFADMITCHTWHHGWLNEGFATYANGLWVEHADGELAFKNYMQGREYFNSGTLYLQQIDDPFNIFISIIYNKGAWTLHMLRGILGDEVFFEAIHTYATSPEFEYGNATTEQFQAVMESVSGKNLEYFFHQWVYEERYPIYEYNYDYAIESGVLGVTINQVQNENGWPEIFTMPVKLKINFNDGTDTLVTVFNNEQVQYFGFEFNKEVDDVEFDPDNWILKEATYNPDITVGIEEIIGSEIKIYPNPNAGTFYIDLPEQISNEVSLQIFNLDGQMIYSTTLPGNTKSRFKVNPGAIQKGIYLVAFTSVKGSWIKKLAIN